MRFKLDLCDPLVDNDGIFVIVFISLWFDVYLWKIVMFDLINVLRPKIIGW